MDQGAHPLGAAFKHRTQGQHHHHRQRQADPSLHLRLAAQDVEFEAKAAVDAAVDPLQRAAPMIAVLPGGKNPKAPV